MVHKVRKNIKNIELDYGSIGTNAKTMCNYSCVTLFPSYFFFFFSLFTLSLLFHTCEEEDVNHCSPRAPTCHHIKITLVPPSTRQVGRPHHVNHD